MQTKASSGLNISYGENGTMFYNNNQFGSSTRADAAASRSYKCAYRLPKRDEYKIQYNLACLQTKLNYL